MGANGIKSNIKGHLFLPFSRKTNDQTIETYEILHLSTTISTDIRHKYIYL